MTDGLAGTLRVARRNIGLLSSTGAPPQDAPSWIFEVDHPYLHGPFAPTAVEYAADDLETIEGELPKDLYGAYFLNGPSQRFRPAHRYHYYDGDAMLRGLYFEDGRARFRQAWIRTESFVVEDLAQRNIWPGVTGPYDRRLPGSPIKDTSNTDVIFYAGRLLSLWHLAGTPYSIDPLTLETVGRETLGGLLTHALSAHSKSDPESGELFFFSYGDEPPYMRYGAASADGRLLHDTAIDLPGPRLPHDLGLSDQHAVLHDLPFFHDAEVARLHGRRVVRFHRDLPARFGVLPRMGAGGDVRWFEAEPCYLLHVVNCWEEGDWLHQVGCRQADPDYPKDPEDGPLAAMLAQRRRLHQLHRWSFNLQTGETRETALDDANTEFPTVHPLRRGRKARYAFTQRIPLPEGAGVSGRCQTFDALVRYDLETGARQVWPYGDGVFGNEAQIAPRRGAGPDAPETDAYVVTLVTDTRDWRSYALVFDAGDISRGPIAKLAIPRRVSLGFHSTFVPGEKIFG